MAWLAQKLRGASKSHRSEKSVNAEVRAHLCYKMLACGPRLRLKHRENGMQELDVLSLSLNDDEDDADALGRVLEKSLERGDGGSFSDDDDDEAGAGKGWEQRGVQSEGEVEVDDEDEEESGEESGESGEEVLEYLEDAPLIERGETVTL
jgi:hypothetical protein